jgi:hypothetical protein
MSRRARCVPVPGANTSAHNTGHVLSCLDGGVSVSL